MRLTDIDAYIDAAIAHGYKGTANVSASDRVKLRGILAHYAKEPHPFRACVRDNRKRFGPGTEAICATIKDLIEGNTHWRQGKQRGEKNLLSSANFPEIPDILLDWLATMTVEQILEYARLTQGDIDTSPVTVEVDRGGKTVTVLNKTRTAKYKALDKDGGEPGTFSAVVSVYGNVDKVGDRVVEGAFDKSLKQWRALGDPIPIVLAHEWKDPFSHIGWVDPAKVKSLPGVGLIVEEGHLDLSNPTAEQVYKLMQRRTMKEFSFGYNVFPGGQKKADDGAMNLTDIDLIEIGPCLKGVNDRTQLLNIKSQIAAQYDEDELTLDERLAQMEDAVDGLVKAYVNTNWRRQRRDNAGRFTDTGPGMDSPVIPRGKPASRRTGYGGRPGTRGRKPAPPLSSARESHMRFLEAQVNDSNISDKVRDEAARELQILRDNPNLAAADPSNPPSRGKPKKQLPGEPAPGFPKGTRKLTSAEYRAQRDQLDRDGWAMRGATGSNYFVSPKKTPDEPVDGNSPNYAEYHGLTPAKEAKRINKQVSRVDALLNRNNRTEDEQDELDDLMGNLHVDFEQYDADDMPPALAKLEARHEKQIAKYLGQEDSSGDQSGKKRPGIQSSEDDDVGDEDAATPEETKYFNDQLARAESLMDSLDDEEAMDSEDLDELMGNLHVDWEQAIFSDSVNDRYMSLEDKWRDKIQRGMQNIATPKKRKKSQPTTAEDYELAISELHATSKMAAMQHDPALTDVLGVDPKLDQAERRLKSLEESLNG